MLEDIEKYVTDKTSELVETLALYGKGYAQMGFDEAEYAGTHDVTVDETHTDRTATVTARGEATEFIEFGTGIHHPDVLPSLKSELKESALLKMHGEFGDKRGANDNGWFFKARGMIHNAPFTTQRSFKIPGLWHTYGNPAGLPMYEARKQVRENIKTLAKGVFK